MMDSTRTREALVLFEEACQLAVADRAAFLDERCGSDSELRVAVEELFRHDDGPDRQDDPFVGAGVGALAAALDSMAGPPVDADGQDAALRDQKIGRYRIVRRVGAGGMATVYEAEQDHPRRRVALKIISPGLLSPKLRQRFELEAQVLARLQHPGIAQVFDAGTADGTTDGTPFIAMELIEGVSLTAFARREKLDMNARLALFVKVCRAVEHAHRNGVIHRDLKPGNILVDSVGQPKVLDFGIARIIDGHMATRQTAAGQLLGTVPYMSPEQISGDPSTVDTRADVYALGVILYELLADRVPFEVADRSIPDAVRIIADSEPVRLGSIHRTYRGDLETIVAKALEKSPDRRYSTVSDLAADVNRYLTSQPIQARPPSATYQFRMMVARHKLPFVFAASLFFVVTAFAIWMSVLYARALTAERRAATQAETARQTTTFLVDLFKVSDPSEARGRTITAGELLDRGAERIRTELEDQPEVRAQLQQTIGVVYTNLGLYEAARPLLDDSIESLRRVSRFESPQLADALAAAGVLRDDLGDYVAAEKMFREAIAIRRRVQPDATLKIANDVNSLGGTLFRLNRNKEARERFQQALDARRAILGEAHSEVAESLQNLGVLHRNLGELDQGERVLRKALAIQEETLPANHPALVVTLYNLGEIRRDRGDLDESRNFYQRAMEIDQAVHGRDHPHFATSLDGLAKAYYANGRYAEAEPIFRDALAMQRRAFGDEHPNVVFALNNLGAIQIVLGDLKSAEGSFAECVDLSRRIHGSRDPQTSIALINYGIVLRFLGKLDEALEAGKEALSIKREAFKGDHPSLANAMHDLAETCLERGEFEQGEALAREGLEMRRRLFGEQHRDVGQSLTGLADLLRAKCDTDTAAEYFKEAASILKASLGESHPDIAYPLEGLGETLLSTNDAAAAEAVLREALDIRVAGLPEGHWQTAITESLLGESLAAQGRFAEAEPLLNKGLRRLSETLGSEHSETRAAARRVESLHSAWRSPTDSAATPVPDSG